MDPGKIFQIITNSTLLATRLLSGAGSGPIEFSEPRYCAVLDEDARMGSIVVTVSAVHKQGQPVRYSITGGNKDGLFTIDQHSGVITLAAALDYEIHEKHELVVAAEVQGKTVHAIVQVRVVDVNDNPPFFLRPEPQLTVIEEDDRHLPAALATVKAGDKDWLDQRQGGLLYTLQGDGVDGIDPADAFFSINPRTGELLQQRALDRDPPRGKEVWKVRVQVRDGQASWPSQDGDQAPWPSREGGQVQWPSQEGGQATWPSHEGGQATWPSHEGNQASWLPQKDGQARWSPRVKRAKPAEGDEEHVAFGYSHRVTGASWGSGFPADADGDSRRWSRQVPGGVQEDKQQQRRHPNLARVTAMVMTGEDQPAGPRDQLVGPKVQLVGLRDQPAGAGEQPADPRDQPGNNIHSSSTPSTKQSMSGGPPETAVTSLTAQQSERINDLKLDDADSSRSTSSSGSRGTSSSAKPGHISPLDLDWSTVASLHSAPTPTENMTSDSDKKELRNIDNKDEKMTGKSESGKGTSDEKDYPGGNMNSSPTEMNFNLGTRAEQIHSRSSDSERKFSRSSQSPGLVSGPKTDLLPVTSRELTSRSHRTLKEEDMYGKIFRPRHASLSRNLFLNGYQQEHTMNSEERTALPQRRVEQHAVLHDESVVEPGTFKQRSEIKLMTLSDIPPIKVVGESSPSEESPHDVSSRGTRAATTPLDDHDDELDDFREGGECEDLTVFGGELRNKNGTTTATSRRQGSGLPRSRGGRVHVVETVVTIVVKDINDNPPVFPNTTMFGEVQENGPIDLSVAVVSAWDADDATEGTNARLTYSIEKNVIHDRTGEAIFTVQPETGLIRTALCCLDRETTPEYHIQVVAADGGGLKGTGTVVVRLADVNDNSPRLARQLWQLEVDETWGDGPPDNRTILEISAADRDDTSNYFYYRVVEGSGWGWQHFGMRSVAAVGQLYAKKTLDFESETHRRGFKFMVQVTDRGRGGWRDPRHLAAAWVTVRLRDLNDNPPQFHQPQAHATVREDAAPGTLLATLAAHDPDMGGAQEVDYHVMDGWGALTVDGGGGVSLRRSLDREAAHGATGVVRVVGVDRGRPPLSATATLTITVIDVNDCAPSLLPPTVLHVAEGGPPTLLGVLTATDKDVWALGHGPPFNLSLPPTNPAHVLDHISLHFDPQMDSGRGGAELWTLGSLDREELRQFGVGVLVSDAGGVSATHTVTVIVDDINDNPMMPGSKSVYLWKTQGGGSEAPLGRVYVDDPDDWDLNDKTFRWRATPHPLFSLNPKDGNIFASSLVRQGRYELQFAVSDALWGQRDVTANVTVTVRVLAADALAHATPVTLTPTTPTSLTRGWTPKEGGGGLGRLLEAVRNVVGEVGHVVEVVSVYGPTPHPNTHTSDATISPLQPTTRLLQPTARPTQPTTSRQPPTTASASGQKSPSARRIPAHRSSASGRSKGPPTDGPPLPPPPPPPPASLEPLDAGGLLQDAPPSACVWISVKEEPGGFMDPIKLQGLLSLHSQQLEEKTGLTVVLEEPLLGPSTAGHQHYHQQPPQSAARGQQQQQQHHPQPAARGLEGATDPSSAATRASTALPLQVVDTNVTSLVTPRLTRAHTCHTHEPEACTPTSCLNGGRCLRSTQANRCVCPGGSTGPRCKVLGRVFFGSGWAWVRPLPRCLPTTISVRLLTRRPEALLLYSGPLTAHPRKPHRLPTPMLALQLRHGRPQVLLEGGGGSLKLVVNTTLNDGDWHTIHLHLNTQGVSLMVDLCGRGWDDHPPDDTHCVMRAAWATPRGGEAWVGTPPLQVGGLAHTPPRPEDHGWQEAPTPRPLDGCLSHLAFDGQLVDLGEPAYSRGSAGGCRPQELACPGGCGRRGRCVGGLDHPECECEPGWAGSTCATPTVPVALGRASYVKVALSFTPAPRVVELQVRVRFRGPRHGLLLRLAAHQHTGAFTIYLREGVACASVSWAAARAATTRAACVEGRPLGDGSWHTVRAERHGHNLVVSVDDGDDWRRNESFVSLGAATTRVGVEEPPTPLEVDVNDGVAVGGLPEFVGVRLVNVSNDLNDSCIDDLRVSGRHLPLPPVLNGTTWGQVTTWQGLGPGCPAPDACLNTTCAPPLTCVSTWGQATCRCGLGRQLVGPICKDVDECLWRPCLHGGTCYNLRPGFECVCGPGHAGQHCQWTDMATLGHPLAAPVAIAALTVSLLLLVVVGVVISLRLRRLWYPRGGRAAGRQQGGVVETKGGTAVGGRGDTRHKAFLECLRLRLPPIHPTPLEKGKKVGDGGASPETDGVQGSTSLLVAGVVPQGGGDPAGPLPLPARDDLRAYAYEGDGSSAGSLTSALSSLREEQHDEGNIKPLVPEFLEVMDLLKNLPEASRSPSLLTKSAREVPAGRTRTRDINPRCKRSKLCALVNRAVSSPPADAKPTSSPSPPTGNKPPPLGEEEQTTVC